MSPLIAVRLPGIVLAVALTAAPAGALGSSLPDLRTVVAGVGIDGRVVAAAVALTSGPWGTDYLTVSHTLRAGRTFDIATEGRAFALATAVAACSSRYHGIDALILRVSSHPSRPVAVWGDPALLRPGDELLILPRQEFSPGLVRVRFVHLNYLEWRRLRPEDIEVQWRNLMVTEGQARPGFSGSPLIRDGRVYGLVKGGARPRGSPKVYVLAEPATRLLACLTQLRYPDLIPTQ